MSQKTRIKVLNNITKEKGQHDLSRHSVITIGRSKQCNVIINNPDISRNHVTVKCLKNSFAVEDLGSKNGTKYFDPKTKTWHPLEGRQTLKSPLKLKLAFSTFLLLDRQEEPDEVEEEAENFSNQSVILNINNFRQKRGICVVDMCNSSSLSYSNETLTYHLKRKLSDFAHSAFNQGMGDFLKNTGDGFLMTFPSATGALVAVRTIFDLVKKRNSSTKNARIVIRGSLHFGEVYSIGQEEIDLHGNDVNIAFRVDGVTNENLISPPEGIEMPESNRILCTDAFIEKLKEEGLPPNLMHQSVGPARLKGIGEPQSISFLVMS